MTDTARAQTATAPLWIRELLKAYPDLSREQLARLTYWFRKEATALDVGMIASDPLLAVPYRRFRADHIDRFSGWDFLVGGLIVAMVAIAIVVVAWLGH